MRLRPDLSDSYELQYIRKSPDEQSEERAAIIMARVKALLAGEYPSDGAA